MDALFHLRFRPWVLPIALVALIAGHAILFYLLRHVSVPRVAVSGIIVWSLILFIIAKHLGLLAGLLRSLHRLFLSRSKPAKSE